MYLKQHTIKDSVTLEGVGLHTGAPARITFLPAPDNHGFIFKRIDLPGQPLILADVDNAAELARGTTIAQNGVKVHTVEHVLAALAGLQIDNALIELDGPEPPILDGSSIEFIHALKSVGIQEQRSNREYLVLDESVIYNDVEKQIDIAAFPHDGIRLTVMVDYNSNILGIQHATMNSIQEFESEFASCRTFCFLHELESLLAQGLIKGGSLNNAIVIVDKDPTPEQLKELGKIFGRTDIEAHAGILNNLEMRFRNEPARHKLLDLLGDLTLLGAPLKAHVMAARPGHAANVAFAKNIRQLFKQKKIIKKYQKSDNKNFVFDINAIMKILPHRYPFILVDKIVEFRENYIEGIKNVTINEPFFQGHFPGNPVMPGVLQLEAMGQVGGVLLLNTIENPEELWVYFVGMDNVKFRKPVLPGDQIVFKLEMINMKRNICKMAGKAYVDDKLVCEAELTASLVKKNP
jgi:UDP-3-O-[3-hydroxymyristoyl] N-acetylglucosamine deacetylase/3-hydroxyacyl-[acyl-carrier-protein] dehydratase